MFQIDCVSDGAIQFRKEQQMETGEHQKHSWKRYLEECFIFGVKTPQGRPYYKTKDTHQY